MAATKMMEHTLIFLIRAYQHTIGMLIPRVCRYEPTCSQYSIEAIREHGIFRGLGLSAWRIIRCNPWCQGGHDPVPVKKNVMNKKSLSSLSSFSSLFGLKPERLNRPNRLKRPDPPETFYTPNTAHITIDSAIKETRP